VKLNGGRPGALVFGQLGQRSVLGQQRGFGAAPAAHRVVGEVEPPLVNQRVACGCSSWSTAASGECCHSNASQRCPSPRRVCPVTTVRNPRSPRPPPARRSSRSRPASTRAHAHPLDSPHRPGVHASPRRRDSRTSTSSAPAASASFCHH
jgi:hypothetical protein